MNEGIQLGVRQTLFSLESFILSEMIFFVKIANLWIIRLSILSLVSALILIPNFQTH